MSLIIKSCVPIYFDKSTVTKIQEIGTSETTGTKGINRSFKLTLDDEKTYIFKPKEGEHISSWRLVPPKTLYIREYLADLVDDQLGFRLVPKTKIVKYKNYIGSLQEWVENSEGADKTLKTYSKEDIWKAGLFDLIIANNDRHSGNWLTKDGKPVLIDNGFSFPNEAKSDDPRSLILSRFSWAIWGKSIPDKFLRAIIKLKNPKFQLKIKKYLDEKSFQLFNKRVDELLNRKKAYLSDYKIMKKLLAPPV